MSIGPPRFASSSSWPAEDLATISVTCQTLLKTGWLTTNRNVLWVRTTRFFSVLRHIMTISKRRRRRCWILNCDTNAQCSKSSGWSHWRGSHLKAKQLSAPPRTVWMVQQKMMEASRGPKCLHKLQMASNSTPPSDLFFRFPGKPPVFNALFGA